MSALIGVLPWSSARSPQMRFRLTCYLNVAVVSFWIEFHNATESVRVQDILEFPKGVACEILAWWRVSEG